MPAAAAMGLQGTQIAPPDTAVEPPNISDFSMMTGFSPWWRAEMAAAIPAAPDPTTSRSQLSGSSGVSGRRMDRLFPRIAAHRPAAVHRQHLPGDEGRFVR